MCYVKIRGKKYIDVILHNLSLICYMPVVEKKSVSEMEKQYDNSIRLKKFFNFNSKLFCKSNYFGVNLAVQIFFF